MNPASRVSPAFPSAWLHRGEILLACGLLFFALTIAVTHFVMGVFLAVIPAIITLPLLVTGVLRSRDPVGRTGRQLGGALLLILGMGLLVVAVARSCALSWQLALHDLRPTAPAPTPQQWLALAATWFPPALCVFAGSSLWTGWTWSRRVFWCGVTVAVSPAAVILHQMLARLGFPITA